MLPGTSTAKDALDAPVSRKKSPPTDSSETRSMDCRLGAAPMLSVPPTSMSWPRSISVSAALSSMLTSPPTSVSPASNTSVRFGLLSMEIEPPTEFSEATSIELAAEASTVRSPSTAVAPCSASASP